MSDMTQAETELRRQLAAMTEANRGLIVANELYEDKLTAAMRVLDSSSTMLREAQQEIARLRAVLMSVSRVLQDPETTGINDTIWLDDLTTLVEHIETTLTGTKEGG